MPETTHSSKEITEMLRDWSEQRRGEILEAIVPLVYEELHRQAHRYLRRERKNHTLQTTALINEAYLKLIEQKNVRFESRTHFFAIAANLMREILVDHARTKHRLKRGGVKSDLPLEEAMLVAADEKDFDLIALDEALTRLGKIDEQQARIVELKFFADLTLQETADVLGISTATVKRDWTMAKVWLHRELTK
ncbi:MAG: sigma-70 family RNA polymerase sigma factor [Acidobacteria bacterium]|jgi:RNA polymerase sigma factor (TIGR02999 family)|nr:sigma-70 family RNA polymerase sigma factor [Acidobacteriota bacterium]